MEHAQSITVVLRSFKSDAGSTNTNQPIANLEEWRSYARSLCYPIEQVLASPYVRHVYVAINGESGSKLAEIADRNGSTPTSRLVSETFSSDRVTPIVCPNWGLNPGSCGAINQVIKKITGDSNQTQWLLVLSKEIQVNPMIIGEMVRTSDLYHLAACGCFRQNHWERYQWGVAQNTICLWDWKTVEECGGFDTRCDGSAGDTISVDGNEVLIAGMDDFHLMLRIQKRYGKQWRWGMVMTSDPLYWDVSAKNATELHNHNMKVLRQEKVMHHYLQEVFPELDWRTVMNQFFSRRISL